MSTQPLWHCEGNPEPFPLEDLISRHSRGELPGQTLVWRKGAERAAYAEWLAKNWTLHRDGHLPRPVSLAQLAEDYFAGSLDSSATVTPPGSPKRYAVHRFLGPAPTSSMPATMPPITTNALPENLDPASPFDVFISYSQLDRALAEEVHALLEGLGLKVWRDIRLLDEPTVDFITHINLAHSRSQRILVLWSQSSVTSRWVREEAERAAGQQRLVALALTSFNQIDVPIGFRNLPTATLDQIRADRELLRRMLPPRDAEHLDMEYLRAIPELGTFNQPRAPKVNAKHLPRTYTRRLYGRDKELQELLAALDSRQTRVVAFDAMGGAGKTALIYAFYQRLNTSDWRDLESVFVWSFYSQGASEEKQAHATEFYRSAFRHFHPRGEEALFESRVDEQTGETTRALRPARELGVELFEHIRKQRTLLILDGLEPLQYGTGRAGETRAFGGIKDDGIKQLIIDFADHGNGLLVITTRIEITDIEETNPSFQRHRLERLPTADAIELLRDRGIEAEKFPRSAYPELPANVKRDFVQAIETLQGHALSLNLAACEVAENHGGDIRAFFDIGALPEDQRIPEAHRSAFKVMQALEAELYRDMERRARKGDGLQEMLTSPPATQLCLLYFLGLFDSPASTQLLPVVFDPRISRAQEPHLTREAVKAYVERCEARAKQRKASEADPNANEADRLDVRVRLTREALADSAALWLRDLILSFQPDVEQSQSVKNALGQLARKGLVSKCRQVTDATTGEAHWENLDPKDWAKDHIDCHPLIREYFGARLDELDRATYQAAHGRLYDHFRFAGLPEEFCDPVVYGVLALRAAYERDHYPKFRQAYLTGQVSDHMRAYGSTEFSSKTAVELKPVFALVDAQYQSIKATFLPDKPAGMEPLFPAVTHGCQAARQHNVFYEVYLPRISRGNEKFAVHKLGLFGQDLAALASFFLNRDPETAEPLAPFYRPSPQLSASDQALVLNLAGFALRALGRLPDAVAPFRAAVALHIQQGDLERAAGESGNLSELLLTLGHVEVDASDSSQPAPGALPTATHAVQFAEKSGDCFMRLVAHSKLGDAAFRAGQIQEAEKSFKEAEKLEGSRMTSFRGFLYGDLLLARRRPQEVAERVAHSLPVAQRNNWLLDIGLDQLNAARAQVGIDKGQGTTDNGPFHQAISSLLNSKNEDDIPRSYLAHAEALLISDCGSRIADCEKALTEAETRARRGPMPLFACDAALLRGRLALVQEPGDSGQGTAKRYRDQAAALIDKHGYGRRKPDLAVLDLEIGLATTESTENTEIMIRNALDAVAEGWWFLIPRLEAVRDRMQDPGLRAQLDQGLARILDLEQAYHEERDAYLKAQEAQPAPSRKPGGAQSGGEIPDAVVEQIFAAPEAQPMLQEVMQDNNLPGSPADLPMQVKRAVIEGLIKAGVIQFQ